MQEGLKSSNDNTLKSLTDNKSKQSDTFEDGNDKNKLVDIKGLFGKELKEEEGSESQKSGQKSEPSSHKSEPLMADTKEEDNAVQTLIQRQ